MTSEIYAGFFAEYFFEDGNYFLEVVFTRFQKQVFTMNNKIRISFPCDPFYKIL